MWILGLKGLRRMPCRCWYFTIVFAVFLCRFPNFNPSLSFVAISAALCRCFKVTLLVRILPLHAGPHLWVVY